MKTTHLLNALHIRGAARPLLFTILLMTAGCDEKFGLSISKPDKICDSDGPATYAAVGPTPVINREDKTIDITSCTGTPVKLLRSGIRTTRSAVEAGYPQGSSARQRAQ